MRRVSAVSGLIAAALIAGASVPAVAQQKDGSAQPAGGLRIAVVNLQRVAAESQVGKTATARVRALNQQKVAVLNQLNAKLQADEGKLASEGLHLTDAARTELQRSIAEEQKDLQRKQQDAQDEVQQLQQELQQSFEARLRPIIKAVAEEKKLSVIFRVEQGELVYWDQSLDLSDEIARRVDAAEPGSAQPAATTPTGSQTPPK